MTFPFLLLSVLLEIVLLTGGALAESSKTKKAKSADPGSAPDAPAAAKVVKPKLSYSECHVPDQSIAITFDDGPHPQNTPRLLDMLKERNIKATFFLIGKNAAAYPDIVKRIVAEGHEVGNHSWTHPVFSQLRQSRIEDELQKTQDAIVGACGVMPLFYRPPYGATRLTQRQWIMDHFHYLTILWDVDPQDWKSPRTAAKVHDCLLKETHAGSIILCHDIHETTVDAMPDTLDALKAKGFQFLTVSQLIALEATSANTPPVAPAAGPSATTSADSPPPKAIPVEQDASPPAASVPPDSPAH